MNDAFDRTRLRSLQDQLIRLAKRHGLSDDTRVSMDAPAEMTIGRLRYILYPEYEALLQRIVRTFQKGGGP